MTYAYDNLFSRDTERFSFQDLETQEKYCANMCIVIYTLSI